MKKTDTVRIWIIAETAVIILLLIAVLIKTVFAGTRDEEPAYSVPSTAETAAVSYDDIELPVNLMDEEEAEMAEESDEPDIYEMDYSDEVMDKLDGMSDQEKLSMLLVTSPEALTGRGKVTQAGEIFRQSYTENPVTGLIFSDSNFEDERSGMEMLKSLREWSREDTGMTLLLGHREQGEQEAEALSDKGFNLYIVPSGTEDAESLGADAAAHLMVPALATSVEAALEREDTEDVPVIAQSNDADEIVSAINSGKGMIFSTDDPEMHKKLTEAVESGDITAEALDHAAGYAVTIRLSLTASRPEEVEKVPEEKQEEAPAAEKKSTSQSSQKKKTEEKKTPEQEAAEALQAAAEAAAKEQQRQAEELQKQIEQAQKEAAKQAEELQKQQAAAAEQAAKQAAEQQAAGQGQ